MQAIPRPEHPRPDAIRGEWLNLNGEWEFAESDEPMDERYLGEQAYPERIAVPFCRESSLSGLGRREFVKNVWYRRTFELPVGWNSPRVRLHVGACDWKARAWVNGEFVGEHRGGSAAFAFEVTAQLKPGANTVVIHAFDDTRSRLQALGKQSPDETSHGCLYTPTTGIWQTVWLEGVGSSYIRDFHIEPDPENSRILIRTEIDGPNRGLTVRAIAGAEGRTVGSAETMADWRNSTLVVDLSEKRLWSPEEPFFYDLRLVLARGDEVIDQVDAYFGLRAVSIQGAAMLINGKAVFQRLVLDQGFYPDGIWTAPSDEALRGDIELSMALGFNGARLHQKVFEPRFLYWADRLGYLVWGEFPNWGISNARPEVNLPVVDEWVEIVRRDRNHASIIGWCPFNETPPEALELQKSVVELTRAIDPSRPVLETSGWTHGIADPEVKDAHDYEQDPAAFRANWTDSPEQNPAAAGLGEAPFMVSEYGGIGWDLEGGWGYGQAPATLDEFYTRYEGLTNALLDNRFMFGFCYTQLTDVEQERNGLYTYDRQPKFDVERIRAINSRTASCEVDPPVC